MVLISCNTIDAKYLKDLVEELINESQLDCNYNSFNYYSACYLL